jgi:hypothetical protein
VKKVFFPCLLVIACGCASDGRLREVIGREPVIHYNRLNVASFAGHVQRFPTPPQRPYGTVKVFETPGNVGQPYDLIGMMSCEGELREEAEIVRAMLYRAADMGADGVILGGAAQPVQSGNVNVRVGWAAVLGNGGAHGFRAQAIKFKADDLKPPS